MLTVLRGAQAPAVRRGESASLNTCAILLLWDSAGTPPSREAVPVAVRPHPLDGFPAGRENPLPSGMGTVSTLNR